MNFCIPFKQNFEYDKEIQEYSIRYSVNNKHFIDFVKDRPNKKINIHIVEEKDFLSNDEITKFILLQKAYPECKFAVVLSSTEGLLYDKIKEANLKFYFAKPATTWEQLYSYIDKGVSEMIIAEGLAFDLENVKKILQKRDIKVRVYPDVAQKAYKNTPAEKSFFIRPEDLSLYEGYIDTIEFFREDKVKTLYKIYAIDKKWLGPLKDLIIGLNSEVDNRGISPPFGQMRRNCNRRCFSKQSCKICTDAFEIAEILKSKNLEIKTTFEN